MSTNPKWQIVEGYTVYIIQFELINIQTNESHDVKVLKKFIAALRYFAADFNEAQWPFPSTWGFGLVVPLVYPSGMVSRKHH